MKRKLFFTVAFFTLCSCVLFAQDLKPKKDKSTKKYGYINKSDEWVVPATYDDADKFKDGYAKIYMNKKEGLINEKGNVVITPQFDDIEKFKKGVALVKKSKKYGFINTDGKILCEPQFEVIHDFDNNNFANIGNSDLWGLIDVTGKIIYQTIFSRKLDFNSKGISIVYQNGKAGLAKNDGTYAMEAVQNSIVAESNYFIINKENGKWIISNEDGAAISKEYEAFMSSYLNTSSKYIYKGIIPAKENGKWGVVDISGNIIIPFTYEAIGAEGYAFSYDFCPVKVGEKWGFINTKGVFFKEPIFSEVERFKSAAIQTFAKVKLDGKSYYLYTTGEMKEDIANSGTTQNTTTTNNNQTTTNTNTSTSTIQPSANTDNNWIVGLWIVTEEKIAGQPKTGNNITHVSYQFTNGGSGTYIERYDVMANKTTNNNISWTFDGATLMIGSNKFTLIPSADKITMTMKGPLGSSWKLTKK